MQIINTIRLIRHSLNVGILSYKTAYKMNLTKIQCKRILIAGLLHDIGKLKLNQNLLNKKGKLSEEEYEYIKLHVNVGVQILNKYKVPESIYKIVEQHHESEDGNGYPNGLKGDDILKESRILRTADVYDALTSNRSYKRKYSRSKAIEIMIKKNVI